MGKSTGGRRAGKEAAIVDGRRILRDLGGSERCAFLNRLGLPVGGLNRLAVATGPICTAGVYVEAEHGGARVLQVGDPAPDGVWIAQRDLDDLRGHVADSEVAGGHGFGEGWGAQGAPVGENPPAAPGAGAVLTDAYLPGATGD